MRRLGLTTLATLLALASIAHAAPRGKLTGSEYRVLVAAVDRAESVGEAKTARGAITELRRLCASVDVATAMMRAVRTDCRRTATLYGGYVELGSEATACVRLTVQANRETCVRRLFGALGEAVAQARAAAMATNREVRARALPARCAKAIRTAGDDLDALKRLDSALDDTRAALADQNATALDQATSRADRAFKFLLDGGSDDVRGAARSCPHL